MDRHIIGSLWDRNNRNGVNKNFEYLFEGRQKIDELNIRANVVLNEAQKTNNMNKDVQRQLNDIILENGDSEAEVVQARGSHELLYKRLDESDAQLADKVNQGDVKVSDINKNLGLIDETYLTDQLKAQIAGTAEIGSTPPDVSVTPKKTTFFTTGKNLFDPAYVTVGYSVNNTTGELYALANGYTSDFIRVEPNSQYSVSYEGKIAYYDSQKNFISGNTPVDTTPKAITTPAECYYLRATFYTAGFPVAQIEKGSAPTYYKPFKAVITGDKVSLDERSVNPENATFFNSSKNLYDPNIANVGYAMASGLNDRGVIFENANTTVTGYTRVEEKTAYTRSHVGRVAFYDADHYFIELLSNANDITFVTPEHCAYIRCQLLSSASSNYQIEKGTIQTPYTPHRLYIPSKYLDEQSSGGATPITSEHTIFNSLDVDGESAVIPIDNNSTAKIVVTKNSRSRLITKVSDDQITWTTLSVKSQDTGNVFTSIYTASSYIADVSGWNYVKFYSKATNLVGSLITAKVVLMNTNPETFIPNIIKAKAKRPSNPSPASTLTNDRQNAYVKPGRTEGVLYSIIGTQTRKSIDNGATWETLFNFGSGASARAVEPLDDGTLLVTTSGGKIWKSDETEKAFTLSATLETPGANIPYGFGLRAYENIVVAAEYGNQTPPDNARKGYLSTDYGATFTKIFEGLTGEGVSTYHTHDISYDPYSKIIWVTNGDGPYSSNVYWSLDMGETWQKVYEYGDCPNQWTAIIPLPNCVLFVSDNKNVGVWRWDRPTNLLQTDSKIVIEPALVIQDEYPGSEPIGTRAGIVYGSDAVAYFGFSFFANSASMHGKIWGTVDGYEFYEMWKSPTIPNASTTNGVMMVADPSVEGNIMAQYLSDDEDGYNIIRIENPMWT